MKTLAICSLELKKRGLCEHAIDFVLCNQNLVFGMMDIANPYSKNIDEEDVLIRIEAFSCNYRDKSLILIFNDMCRNKSKNGQLFYTPFGSEFVATVLQVGKRVQTLKVGDRVIPDGAYPIKVDGRMGALPTNCASQRFQVFHWSYLVKVPDEMPNESAASFTIAGQTVFSMIRKLQLKSGEKVLVTAATSNTSLAAISALKGLGVDVYACSTSKSRIETLMSMGVKSFFSSESLKNNPDYLPHFDAVIDPFLDIYFCDVIKLLNIGGRYITCGNYNQNSFFPKSSIVNQDVNSILNHCIINNISIIGNCLGTREDLENAITSYQKGQFDIVIDSVYTETDINSFLSKTFHLTPRFGKVVFKYEL